LEEQDARGVPCFRKARRQLAATQELMTQNVDETTMEGEKRELTEGDGDEKETEQSRAEEGMGKAKQHTKHSTWPGTSDPVNKPPPTGPTGMAAPPKIKISRSLDGSPPHAPAALVASIHTCHTFSSHTLLPHQHKRPPHASHK